MDGEATNTARTALLLALPMRALQDAGKTRGRAQGGGPRERVLGGTIELPFWLIVVIGVLALMSLVDRLLVPSLRWMLRRRVNEAIDELNARLKLRIQPFKLTKRESLIDRIVYDADLARAIEAHSEQTGEPRDVTFTRVKGYAKEIVPSFNAWAYFKFGTHAARWLSNALYRVRLGYYDEDKIKAIDPDATVVFVINHRSNMDYVLVTYLAAASSALSYAVGEWARVMLLQTLIRSMGAYFIRRDSSDPLYRKVLARYVQIATAEGVTQAVFPEGGLTRDGALRPARLGLLSYIVGRFDLNGPRDVVFIPVGINYDRVIEDRNLTASIAKEAGTPHQRRGAKAVAGYLLQALGLRLSGRWHKFGYASVSFGEPLSLKSHLNEGKIDLRRLDETQRFEETDKIAKALMARIARIVPVLPVPLIATIFETAGSEALSLIDIKTRAQNLVETLRARGVHVHVPRQDLDYALEVGLRIMTMRHLVEETEGMLCVNPREAVLIRYYSNSIAHHFARHGAKDGEG
jgi:glycerol-3-phosphate O-acyltransferase